MAEGHGASINIQALQINADGLGDGKRDRSKGLIDFDQINLVNAEVGLLEHLFGGGNGRRQHHDRIVTSQ